MIADSLNRARVPFWTKAGTVRSSSELEAALEIGGIDLCTLSTLSPLHSQE